METVYPTPPSDRFFSAIPRYAIDLASQGKIQHLDISTLSVLLDYRNRDNSLVWPCQVTLAHRMGFSLDTLQRSLARLAAAGLIIKRYVADRQGNMRRLIYDLANVIALVSCNTQSDTTKSLDHHTAKLRCGDPNDSHENLPDSPPSAPSSASVDSMAKSDKKAKPHPCGLEADSDVDEANNNSARIRAACDNPPSAAAGQTAFVVVVDSLQKIGVTKRIAARLVERFGIERCKRHLDSLPHRKSIRDRAAYLVAGIQSDWTPAPIRPAAARQQPPASQPAPNLPSAKKPAPNLPSAKKPAPNLPPARKSEPDPLDSLPADQYAHLEEIARAMVVADFPRIIPQLVAKGRSRPLIRSRMREILAGSIKSAASDFGYNRELRGP